MKLLGFFRRRATTDSFPLESIALTVEPLASANVRLITAALRAEGVRELELTEVPPDLQPFAVDLLSRVAARVREEKPQRDGEVVAGQLVSDRFPPLHIATLRVIARSIEPGAEELFRLVDYEEQASTRFAPRLLGTHLAALSAIEPDRAKRVSLAQRSVELFPGTAARGDGQFEFDRGENLNNYAGWEALGDALIESGETADGLQALARAVERCPAWAHDFATHVAQTPGAAESNDPRVRFWMEVRSVTGGRS